MGLWATAPNVYIKHSYFANFAKRSYDGWMNMVTSSERRNNFLGPNFLANSARDRGPKIFCTGAPKLLIPPLCSTITWCGKTPTAVTWSEPSLPCHCYATKANIRTISSQVSQPASAGKGVDVSDLQGLSPHHCMTPEHWTWFLCSVSDIPENKLSLHKIN